MLKQSQALARVKFALRIQQSRDCSTLKLLARCQDRDESVAVLSCVVLARPTLLPKIIKWHVHTEYVRSYTSTSLGPRLCVHGRIQDALASPCLRLRRSLVG